MPSVDDIERDVRAGLAAYRSEAPVALDISEAVRRGRRRRRARRATLMGPVLLVVLVVAGLFTVDAPFGRGRPDSIAAGPTSTPAPQASILPMHQGIADGAFAGYDGSWTISTRRSTTPPGLICQDLVRQGAVSSTRTGNEPTSLDACASADPAYASYHHAYAVRPGSPAAPNTVEWGRAAQGTVSVRLTGSDGQVDVATEVFDGVVVWATEVPTASTAAVAVGPDGSITDLMSRAAKTCPPATVDLVEVPAFTTCPHLTTDPGIVQTGGTPAAESVSAQVTRLLPAGWKLTPTGGTDADGTVSERAVESRPADGINVLVQERSTPTDFTALPGYLTVTRTLTGDEEATSDQEGFYQVIVQRPAGLFVNITYSVYSGEPELSFDQVQSIAEMFADQPSSCCPTFAAGPPAVSVAPTPSPSTPAPIATLDGHTITYLPSQPYPLTLGNGQCNNGGPQPHSICWGPTVVGKSHTFPVNGTADQPMNEVLTLYLEPSSTHPLPDPLPSATSYVDPVGPTTQITTVTQISVNGRPGYVTDTQQGGATGPYHLSETRWQLDDDTVADVRAGGLSPEELERFADGVH